MNKIVIIEDDLAISQMYRMKFEAEDDQFQVFIAKNGADGLELIKKVRPDLVLLDLRMPIMDGMELLQTVRKDEAIKDTKIVILTNSGLEESPAHAKSLGVEDYIVKANYTPSQVVNKIKNILNIK